MRRRISSRRSVSSRASDVTGLATLRTAYRDRLAAARRAAARGKRVIGLVGHCVPVELVWAAGCFAVQLTPSGHGPTPAADGFMEEQLDRDTRSLFDRFLRGEFDPPDFALKLAHKDVMLATELGREIGVPMRVAELTRADMLEALNRGWEARDSRVPMLLQEERAGVSIKVPPADIEAVIKRDG